MLFSLTLGLLTAVIPAYAYAAPSTTVVDLGYAKYQGSLNEQSGNIEFLGIRYAAAPTGSLRWREPQQPRTTPGVQLANAPPNTCWLAPLGSIAGTQPTTPFRSRGHGRRQLPGSPPPSEDCLYLNIATPALGDGNLPVVIWIHGGGYITGSAFMFDGDDLIRQAGGKAVVVIIQYRLGLFGFLPGQKVHDGGALNVGLLDQQFAFQWVQRHIRKFGGDPGKVTIWGESAGAGSVLQHIVANDGNTQPPLFRAAMASSTFLPSQYAFNDKISERIFAEVVEQTGCSTAANSLDCLRLTDVQTLQRANLNVTISGFFGTSTFVPVVDGKLITKRPTQLLREGKLNGHAFLGVTNSFEGFYPLFVDNSTADTVQTPTYLANLFPMLTQSQIAAGTVQYSTQGTPINQARAIMGESIFICPMYFLLRAFGGRGFKGEFAVPPALHGDDIIYYFPNGIAGQSIPFNNTQFINNFSQSFMNFVLVMNPNVKWDASNTVPLWSRWTEEDRAEMVFNKTEAGEPVFHSVKTAGDLLDRCDFWESVSAFTGQ